MLSSVIPVAKEANKREEPYDCREKLNQQTLFGKGFQLE